MSEPGQIAQSKKLLPQTQIRMKALQLVAPPLFLILFPSYPLNKERILVYEIILLFASITSAH